METYRHLRVIMYFIVLATTSIFWGCEANGSLITMDKPDDTTTSQRESIEFLPPKVISAGAFHTVGLLKDGTVVAIGDNKYGQCSVDDWTDIVSVSGGGWHSVGLRSDGKVVAVGDNRYVSVKLVYLLRQVDKR